MNAKFNFLACLSSPQIVLIVQTLIRKFRFFKYSSICLDTSKIYIKNVIEHCAKIKIYKNSVKTPGENKSFCCQIELYFMFKTLPLCFFRVLLNFKILRIFFIQLSILTYVSDVCDVRHLVSWLTERILISDTCRTSKLFNRE